MPRKRQKNRLPATIASAFLEFLASGGAARVMTRALCTGMLPVSIILLGQMIFWQAAPLFQAMAWLMNTLGSVGAD